MRGIVATERTKTHLLLIMCRTLSEGETRAEPARKRQFGRKGTKNGVANFPKPSPTLPKTIKRARRRKMSEGRKAPFPNAANSESSRQENNGSSGLNGRGGEQLREGRGKG